MSKGQSPNTHARDMLHRPLLVLFAAIAGIGFGLFFIFSQSSNQPIPRDEAVSYSGAFERYETGKNYCMIYFRDGSCYEVYPHTEPRAFREAMTSLDAGTMLYILVNPHNEYVVEVKTDSEELLNFDLSQQAIDSYDNGYIAIGIAACIAGCLLILYVIGSTRYQRKERERHARREAAGGYAKTNAVAMREAAAPVKGKLLLEAHIKGYDICYRRVKAVNELVINGQVYDEKKGIIEWEHTLCAVVDGHSIEAGLDEESFSFIRFDGKTLRRKKRCI